MARWLGWIDNFERPRPRFGSGSVEDVVSHLPKTRAQLAASASMLQMVAQGRLDSLPKHRTGRSQVKLQHRDLDYIVILDEGEHGKGGAAGIEARFGILGGAAESMRIV